MRRRPPAVIATTRISSVLAALTCLVLSLPELPGMAQDIRRQSGVDARRLRRAVRIMPPISMQSSSRGSTASAPLPPATEGNTLSPATPGPAREVGTASAPPVSETSGRSGAAPPGQSTTARDSGETTVEAAESTAGKGSDADENKRGDEKPERKRNGNKAGIRGEAPCRSWAKAHVPIRACLVCIHGLGLNSASFEEFGSRLSRFGLAVYAIDVRGFGSWMAAEGHESVDFDACIEDVRETLEWVRKDHPGRSVFLLGESMGGAIALQTAAKYPHLLDGVISACASGDRFRQNKTDLKVALRLLTGNRDVDVGETVVDQATDCNVLKQTWKGDPLNRLKISPKEFLQFQRFMNGNHEAARKIVSLPALVVQGSRDGLVKPEGTKELFDELATPDKEWLLVPGAEHLIFEEGQFPPEVLVKLADWLKRHAPEIASFASAIGRAKAAMAADNFAEALSIMEAQKGRAMPDAEGRLLMGTAHLRLGHYGKARQQLRLAMRMGRGTEVEREANRVMMALPGDISSPMFALAKDRRMPLPGDAHRHGASKPTVVVFHASWSDPCKQLQSVIDQAKAKVGDKVDFVMIDVDDPANEQIVEEYSIGPVPTTVFVSASRLIADICVGYAGVDGMIKGMRTILPPAEIAGRRAPPNRRSMRRR